MYLERIHARLANRSMKIIRTLQREAFVVSLKMHHGLHSGTDESEVIVAVC